MLSPPGPPDFTMSSPRLDLSEDESPAVVLCGSHQKPSTRLVSKTAKNVGRAFYICSQKQSCDYFGKPAMLKEAPQPIDSILKSHDVLSVWEDEVPVNTGRSGRSSLNTSSRNPSSPTTDSAQIFEPVATTLPSNRSLSDSGAQNNDAPTTPSLIGSAAPGVRLGQSDVRAKAESAPIDTPTSVAGTIPMKTTSSPSSMSWNNARERAMAKRRADLATRTAQSRSSHSAGSVAESEGTTSGSIVSPIPSTVIQTPPLGLVSESTSRMDATTRKGVDNTANAGDPSLSRSRVSETAVPVVAVKQEHVGIPTRGSSAPNVAEACASSDFRKRKEAESRAQFTDPRKKPCPERVPNANTQEGLQAMVAVAGPSMPRSESVQSPAIPDESTDLNDLLQQTRPEEWKYLSEGGANVVYVYRGWREAFKDKALRIKKRAPGIGSSVSRRQSTTPNDYWQEKMLPHVLQHADRDARGLLPTRKKMHVNRLWIRAMNDQSKKDRPAHRLQSEYADLENCDQDSLVVLTDDLIGGAGHIAIEIKPKAGFVPSMEGLDPKYVPIKIKACKYCMKRCVTNGQGDIGYGFCPIDLFSKDYAPRSRALQCLAEAWNLGDAGNNMKVFVDGEIVHSATEAKPNANLGDYRDPLALARLVNNALSSSGVLDTLLYLQKLFDRNDIQELARLASPESYVTQKPFSEQLCIEPYATECANIGYRRSSGDPDPLTRQRQVDVRYACMAYAIAAIFKDCSVMLRWPIDQLSAVAEQPCIVKLVDLDLKPMKNLNKWWQQDRDLCSIIQQRGMTVACGAGGIQGSDYQIFRFPTTWKPAWEAVPKRPQRSRINETEVATARLLAKAQSDNTILRERTARLERALMNIGVQVVEAGLQTR